MKIKFLFLLISVYTLLSQPLSAQEYSPALFSNLELRNVGPANMSGRISAIDVVEKNTNVMYVGAASGGVWKSENGGSAWKPVFDEAPTQNIGALAIQQSNPDVVYVGTGEGNPRNSMNLGMGIFRSLDGGRTWQHLGLEKTKTIHRIIIHPDNPNIIFVGAMGDPFSPNSDRGVYKSIDGGKIWKNILFTNDSSGVADMVQDPNNPNKIFVAMYQHRRTPYSFTSGGPGSGLYMTIDGGETWNQLDHDNGLPQGELGRIGIAIAPSNSNRIYAKIEASKNALYRSDDGGYQWEMINDNPKFTNNRPFYFQDLAVDSKDQNRLYNIYQPLSVSYDGGLTFDSEPMIPADETKGIHADFHAFWMNPNDPKHFIIGGDGGIGITRDHGQSWYFPESIPVAQCYHIGVDNETPYNVYAGMQDNGNWSGPGYVWKRGGIRTLYWQYLVGGDGFYISPDDPDARYGYGTSQNGDLYRYDKLTGYYISVKPSTLIQESRLRFNWNAGFARDPFNKKGIYYGSQYLLKSDDQGAAWEIISPDLTRNNPAQQKEDYGGLTVDKSGAEFFNSILAIAPSKLERNVIWVGTDDGNVQLSKDGAMSWTNLTEHIKGLPKESWIARIHASHHNASEAWIVANNYRKGDYDTYVFRTKDYGQTWTRIANQSHIKGYALSFIQDPIEPNLQFLGTEHGLWISTDDGEVWNQIKNGFPSVSTMDLAIQERESALIIGTFGRAIWILDDLQSLRKFASGNIGNQINIVQSNPTVQVKGLFINPPGNIWTGFNTTFEGENRPFRSLPIAYFANEKYCTQQVNLEVFNSKNESLQTVQVPENPQPGLNYIHWNLDEAIDRLPNSYINEESRGIPVIPGTYKLILSCGSEKDSSYVQINSDPRFDLRPEVDEELYKMQKQLNGQRIKFNESFTSLEALDTIAREIKNQLPLFKTKDYQELIAITDSIRSRIKSLKEIGLGSRPNRQLGAWQSFQVTPASLIKEAERFWAAKNSMTSEQDKTLLQKIEWSVSEYSETIQIFIAQEWAGYKTQMIDQGLNWLSK